MLFLCACVEERFLAFADVSSASLADYYDQWVRLDSSETFSFEVPASVYLSFFELMFDFKLRHGNLLDLIK